MSTSGHVRRFSRHLLSEMQPLRWIAFRLGETGAAMLSDFVIAGSRLRRRGDPFSRPLGNAAMMKTGDTDCRSQ